MTIHLVKDDEISYKGVKRSSHDNDIRCRMCGGTTTEIHANGESIWIKDKDIKRNWNSYLCYKCVYQRDKFCYKCGVDNLSADLLKRYSSKGLWTGEYICDACICKSKAKCRNRGISRDSTMGKLFIAQQIVAKVRGLKSCKLETDNFRYEFDFCDPKYSRIKVRVATIISNKWSFKTIGMENCDTVFLICMDKMWKDVKRVYIIPGGDVYTVCIYIYEKSSSTRPIEYDIFRTDEKIYNDAYHSLNLKNCTVLKP